eukprot:3201239-Rhodomonas_salina.1
MAEGGGQAGENVGEEGGGGGGRKRKGKLQLFDCLISPACDPFTVCSAVCSAAFLHGGIRSHLGPNPSPPSDTAAHSLVIANRGRLRLGLGL